jgi:superfamily I DNA/RNA helicase
MTELDFGDDLSSPSVTPTQEQQAIVDAFADERPLVVNAGAGTGKTSTLRMLADSQPDRTCLYIAYNRAIADDSRGKFPSNTYCATAHSLAFRAVGRDYSHRLGGGRTPSWVVAQTLGIRQPITLTNVIGNTVTLPPAKLASLTMDMVKQFCYSSAKEIRSGHLGLVTGIDIDQWKVLGDALLPYARAAWSDLARIDGTLPFSHDIYLKLWALSGPHLDYDVIFLDEAQDANPAIAEIVDSQAAQRVLVGDQAQAIYGWRGAVDAMETFDGDRLVLSQSFRFGEAIANEANVWLELLQAPLRLTGYDKITSTVGRVDDPRAVLCRTNAGAVLRLMQSLEADRRPALVGGGAAIKAMARASLDLKAGRGTSHYELLAFRTWEEVREFVETESAGSDLRVFVRLIDDYSAETVIKTLDSSTSEEDADVIVSTAHKAKGREWESVAVAADFPDRVKGEAERMLAYVTVTRAKERLDKGKLRG